MSATTATTPTAKSRKNALRRRNTLLGWSFILPNFIGFALITMVPIVALFYISFTDWNAFGNAGWVGFENYADLFGNRNFRIALVNTFYYAIPHILLTGVISLALAVLLNRKMRGIAFFRTAAFFPYITSIVAIAIVWNLLFSPDYGPINQILGVFGVDNPPGWTTSADWSMPAVIIVGTWREMGYYMLLFLAGLQTIPHELYEAATLDGAGKWKQFLHITWPGLRPTTFFIMVMLTIGSFKVFDLILVMTDGGPGTSTLVISQYIYQQGIENNKFGYSSAAAVVLFFICLAVTLVQFAVNRRNER
ncbi:MAG: sugar ABC transporter permease [Propionibacteriaceae bacterium]|jgi:ABC-type sugar transport system permease subunit|nr:sugar ABC transporter permease [Propionibacteriaceae bacterium]